MYFNYGNGSIPVSSKTCVNEKQCHVCNCACISNMLSGIIHATDRCLCGVVAYDD